MGLKNSEVLENLLKQRVEMEQQLESLRATYLKVLGAIDALSQICLLYTSPSPRDKRQSRMPSSA